VPVRVSVVVPVYNPGPHFDDLLASLLRQSLPATDFEVLFCDDGSDAETRQRLAAATAAHRHLKVIQLEHSGWPGRPRNAGIDAARGGYLFFCDHDDRFSDEGLERLCDYADANGSDVVFGKVVGVGRELRLGTFQRNVPRAVLGVDPLLDLLTPHKLFRTAFVRERGIRFPEGRVRLEDHVFVMQAYFAARVISVLADHPCYYWTVRQDRPSASAGLIDPAPYFGFLRQVLDIVEAGCGPGDRLDHLLPHWYGLKVLERLGPGMLEYPGEYRTALLETLHPLVEERFPARIDQYLPFPLRLRSALLRAGRDEDLLALAEVEAAMTCNASATSVSRTADGRLRVAVRAELTLGNGRPLTFSALRAEGSGASTRAVWQLPATIAPDVLTPAVLDAAADLAQDTVQVFVRDLADQSVDALGGPSRGTTAAVHVDPRAARFGRGLPEHFTLFVALRRAGWSTRAPLDLGEDRVD
jgi:glycosyltransferase involved in cell wall biosynthesis